MQANIEQLVHRVVDQARGTRFIPGGVVAAVGPGGDDGPSPFTAVVPFGTADVATGRPVGPETAFEIGSLSKLFTALVLATVVADPASGVDLRTPLQEHAPVQVPQDGPTPITLAHLITHRSGLPRMPGNAVYDSIGRSRYSAADLWSAVAASRLLYPPGESWLYSNFGFGVIGTVLTELRGQPYETLIADAVCRPLGLIRTGVQPPLPSTPHHLAWWRHLAEAHDDGPDRDIATPYHQGSTPQRPVVAERWNDIGALAGSGGVVSTGTDMAKFLVAAVGDDARPSYAPYRMIRQLMPAADPTLKRMGMAWQYRDSKLPGQLLFKNGGTRGMHCAMGIRHDGPYAGTGVVMLTNGPDPVDAPALEILAAVGRMAAGETTHQ